MGYIYIMETPAKLNVVKLGYADDVSKRLSQLNGANPDSFHVYAIYKTADRLTDKSLHNLIDALNPNLRYDPHKEFYEMSAENAYKIFESIAKINGLQDSLILNPYHDDYFKNRIENMTSYGRPKVPGRVSFEKLNIPVGAILTLNIDTSITVTVADTKNHVIYDNKKKGTVSDVASILRKRLKHPYKSINGWIEFSYNGISLGELRDQYWTNKNWSNE